MTRICTGFSPSARQARLMIVLLSVLCGGVAQVNAYDWSAPLESSTGASLSFDDFAGRTTLLSFFFTRCQGACPQQARLLARVQRELTDEVKMRTAILSISLDPKHDTPAAMRTFAEAHGADTRHWTFARITGPDTLQRLLDQVSVKVGASDVRGQIDHRMTLLLVGPTAWWPSAT
ncbi:MAG: SCO family protein [Pseudomonadota bacterium]